MEYRGTYEDEVITGLEFNAMAYTLFYKAIINGKQLAKRIPDFVINESLRHFEKKEQYEKCSVIKKFFDMNRSRIFHMSRNDWMNYGWSMAKA